MRNHETKIKYLVTTLLLFCLSFNFALAETIDDINKQINDKKNSIEDLKSKMEAYQKSINKTQSEAASLANQLSILENEIAKAELNFKATINEIAQTQLEIKKVELTVLAKEDAINQQKNNLTETLQAIYKADQENAVRIFILHNSLSDFFNQVEYTKNLQTSLQESLSILKDEKTKLLSQKDELTKKQEELTNLKQDLELQRAELTGQVTFKNALLIDTQESEQKYNALLQQSRQEQQAISNDLAALEKKIRSKLNKEKTPTLTDSTLDWPILNAKITATFHDPEYPFRYIFEHPAIDIRAAQGTSIRAPADGYVLKTHDGGMGYSYISLIHANGLSTVYGHVSAIYVLEDAYVRRGDIIGLSGAMPGTPGAGKMTTGPHLHFEVRLNGIPVNPLNYLP